MGILARRALAALEATDDQVTIRIDYARLADGLADARSWARGRALPRIDACWRAPRSTILSAADHPDRLSADGPDGSTGGP